MEFFVHALFRDEKNAARAVQKLVDADFEPDQISALMRVDGKAEEIHLRFKTGVGRGAALGAAIGVIGGALVASGAGLAAAGPLVAGLEGALLGGVAGGATGALGGLGRWTEELELPEHGDGGMILIGVSTGEGRVSAASEALASAKPERIHVAGKAEACREVQTGVLTGVEQQRKA